MEESGLKITKVRIMGMHKVQDKTYELNDAVTYFIGENGAGKSTILEAIQLGLLGYIPGYSKTNDGIMKHASSPVMCIELYIDDSIKVIRTWAKLGSSVQAKVEVEGYEGELKDLLGNVDLPVFDFNEFKSMTANKLKDWFITFLPSCADRLDIRAELSNAIGGRAILNSELIEETVNWCNSSGSTGLELVRKLNEKFKADQSFTKGQIAKLQGTIQSLVRYDDAIDCDVDSANDSIRQLNSLKSQLMKYNTELAIYQKAKISVDSLKAQLPADIYDNDARVLDIKTRIEDLTKKNEVMEADYSDLVKQIRELEQRKATIPKAGSNCPYTGTACPTAQSLVDKYAKEVADIDGQIQFKKEELKDYNPAFMQTNRQQIMQLTAELGTIQSQYDKLIAMNLQLENAVVGEKPTEITIEEIDAKLSELNNQLIQVAANKKYDELNEQVTADKFKLENELEIYKEWAKLTDANGLQTRLMDAPFQELACDMSSYLSQMFNKPITARFNLVSKANSFSFGLERDHKYIEFDYLSSGERCLFTLALIVCILNRSNSIIRTILIDDILDHLDSDNASYLFNALKTIDNTQFILAGVKECLDEGITKSV